MSLEQQDATSHGMGVPTQGSGDVFYFEAKQPLPSTHLQEIQVRLTLMENQLEKKVTELKNKEKYVNALAEDLEHIMLHLIKRMNKESICSSRC